MSDQMTVRVSFTDWNTYDNNYRSFINFFIDNAVISVTPQNGDLVKYIYLSYTARIDNNDYNYYVSIPCDNGFSTQSANMLFTVNSYDINNSLCKIAKDSSNRLFGLPLEIKSIVDDNEVNDSDYLLTDMYNNGTMIDYTRTYKFSHSSQQYKYLCRTPNFGISMQDNSSYELFYKIGVFFFPYYYYPTSYSYTSYVSNSQITNIINDIVTNSSIRLRLYNLGCSGDNVLSITSLGTYYEDSTTYIPNTMIVPILYSNKIYGIMYAKLYNKNGVEVQYSIGGSYTLNSLQCVDSNGIHSDATSGSDNVISLSLVTDHIDDNALIPSV